MNKWKYLKWILAGKPVEAFLNWFWCCLTRFDFCYWLLNYDPYHKQDIIDQHGPKRSESNHTIQSAVYKLVQLNKGGINIFKLLKPNFWNYISTQPSNVSKMFQKSMAQNFDFQAQTVTDHLTPSIDVYSVGLLIKVHYVYDRALVSPFCNEGDLCKIKTNLHTTRCRCIYLKLTSGV